MEKAKLLATAFAVAAFSISGANAADKTEKCKVVNAHGKEVTVEVAPGECEKLNKGDFSGVDEAVKEKIEAGHDQE